MKRRTLLISLPITIVVLALGVASYFVFQNKFKADSSVNYDEIAKYVYSTNALVASNPGSSNFDLSQDGSTTLKLNPLVIPELKNCQADKRHCVFSLSSTNPLGAGNNSPSSTSLAYLDHFQLIITDNDGNAKTITPNSSTDVGYAVKIPSENDYSYYNGQAVLGVNQDTWSSIVRFNFDTPDLAGFDIENASMKFNSSDYTGSSFALSSSLVKISIIMKSDLIGNVNQGDVIYTPLFTSVNVPYPVNTFLSALAPGAGERIWNLFNISNTGPWTNPPGPLGASLITFQVATPAGSVPDCVEQQADITLSDDGNNQNIIWSGNNTAGLDPKVTSVKPNDSVTVHVTPKPGWGVAKVGIPHDLFTNYFSGTCTDEIEGLVYCSLSGSTKLDLDMSKGYKVYNEDFYYIPVGDPYIYVTNSDITFQMPATSTHLNFQIEMQESDPTKACTTIQSNSSQGNSSQGNSSLVRVSENTNGAVGAVSITQTDSEGRAFAAPRNVANNDAYSIVSGNGIIVNATPPDGFHVSSIYAHSLNPFGQTSTDEGHLTTLYNAYLGSEYDYNLYPLRSGLVTANLTGITSTIFDVSVTFVANDGGGGGGGGGGGPIVSGCAATVSSSGHGTVDPSGAVSIDDGKTQAFNLVPETGYQAETYSIVGGKTSVVSLNGSKSFNFACDLGGTYNILVTFFGTKTISVNSTPASDGTALIASQPSARVAIGADADIVISPKSGFSIDSITDNDVPISVTPFLYNVGDGLYHFTISNVTADHTVIVVFKASDSLGASQQGASSSTSSGSSQPTAEKQKNSASIIRGNVNTNEVGIATSNNTNAAVQSNASSNATITIVPLQRTSVASVASKGKPTLLSRVGNYFVTIYNSTKVFTTKLVTKISRFLGK